MPTPARPETPPPASTPKPRRRRCKNCGELFPKTRHNREFCGDPCRKEFHRHAGAFAPLKIACEKFIETRIATILAESRSGHQKAEQLIARCNQLIEQLKEAASIARRERNQATDAAARLEAATAMQHQSSLLLQSALSALKTTTTTTTTNRDTV